MGLHHQTFQNLPIKVISLIQFDWKNDTIQEVCSFVSYHSKINFLWRKWMHKICFPFPQFPLKRPKIENLKQAFHKERGTLIKYTVEKKNEFLMGLPILFNTKFIEKFQKLIRQMHLFQLYFNKLGRLQSNIKKHVLQKLI